MNIMVGYIDTPEGRAALERGIDEARERGARLHVVHVAKAGTRADPSDEIVAYKQAMERLDERLREEGLEGRAWEVISAQHKATALLEVAAQVEADLLVLGIRRRSPVGKLVLGSTAQDVILRAECAVLAVKARAAS